MTDWIKKTVYPPGIEKPNRLALFSVVGEVMSRVRKDAEKAFYAHFPYLADDKKLEEHGEALLIPRLQNDTPEEYRNRVATASFFLMRAGERAYIMEQLKERFGDRFLVVEEFLSIHTRVAELTDNERVWVLSLFDSLVDPNIYLELSDWIHYIEHIPSHDAAAYKFGRWDFDFFDGKIYRNGRILRDGYTVRHQFGMCDITTMKSTISITDSIENVYEQFTVGIWKYHFHNGKYRRDELVMRDSMILVPLE